MGDDTHPILVVGGILFVLIIAGAAFLSVDGNEFANYVGGVLIVAALAVLVGFLVWLLKA